MSNIFKTKLFWGLTLFISGVIFWSLLGMNRGYAVYSDILLIPKNPASAASAEQIVANASILPTELTFYKNLLAFNEDLTDPWKELSPGGKKKRWSEKISTEYLEKSGIVRLINSDHDIDQALKLNKLSTKELIRELSGFYNIKTELDVRIIDGPIALPKRNLDPILAIIVSLISGALVAAVAMKLSEIIEHAILKSGILSMRPKISSLEFFKKFDTLSRSYDEPYEIPKKKEVSFLKKEQTGLEEMSPAASSETKTTFPDVAEKKPEKEIITKETKKEPEKPTPTASSSKKGAAPDNLPVMKEEDVFKVRTEKSQETKSEIKEIIKEPTPEEVKERLNKLLSGNF